MAFLNMKGTKEQDVPENRMSTIPDLRASAAETEEGRINGEIEQTKKEIDTLYADIGKEYYEAQGQEPISESMAAHFQEIEEKKGHIQDLNEEIRSLRGLTTCEQCGADILVTDTFCSNCGARIISEVAVSPTGGRCPSCGRALKQGQMFCSTCGAKVMIKDSAFEDEINSEKTKILEPLLNETTGGEAEPEEFMEETVVEEVTEQEPEMPGEEILEEEMPGQEAPEEGTPGKRVCLNCGKELQEGMMFCVYCGEPVVSSADTAPSSEEETETSQPAGQEPSLFCSNCGTKLEPGDLFCINCGKKVES